MRLHVQTLFRTDPHGRLLEMNDGSRAPAPRIFLGATEDGNEWWVRQDVGPETVAELPKLIERFPTVQEVAPNPAMQAALVEFAARTGEVNRIWSGPAYECSKAHVEGPEPIRVSAENADCLAVYLPDWTADAKAGVPMVASIENGAAVAVCCSVRIGRSAQEAGVETHPDFRGRGHGKRVVAAWARVIRGMGQVPLYSTSWENRPSRALAESLGLRCFGADIHIS